MKICFIFYELGCGHFYLQGILLDAIGDHKNSRGNYDEDPWDSSWEIPRYMPGDVAGNRTMGMPAGSLKTLWGATWDHAGTRGIYRSEIHGDPIIRSWGPVRFHGKSHTIPARN